MNKRNFLAGCTAVLGQILARPAASGSGEGELRAGGTVFTWRHAEDRLHALFTAPTSGWLAAGFNASPGLRGTRFIIAAVATTPIRVEEHVALVPEHRRVSDLGLAATMSDTGGSFENGLSHLRFSLPVQFSDNPELNLAPGRRTNLMLAWSQAPDFMHHSAWRRHFDILL